MSSNFNWESVQYSSDSDATISISSGSGPPSVETVRCDTPEPELIGGQEEDQNGEEAETEAEVETGEVQGPSMGANGGAGPSGVGTGPPNDDQEIQIIYENIRCEYRTIPMLINGRIVMQTICSEYSQQSRQ